MKLSELKSIIREKLCKKGEAYRKKRMAAGEKSSAYLSGRAVKVCKGQMAGENIDPKSQKQHKGKSTRKTALNTCANKYRFVPNYILDLVHMGPYFVQTKLPPIPRSSQR